MFYLIRFRPKLTWAVRVINYASVHTECEKTTDQQPTADVFWIPRHIQLSDLIFITRGFHPGNGEARQKAATPLLHLLLAALPHKMYLIWVLIFDLPFEANFCPKKDLLLPCMANSRRGNYIFVICRCLWCRESTNLWK